MELARHGVGVTVICPGYVRSRITAGQGPLPLLLESAAAAALIERRLRRNPVLIAFPWPLHLLVWLIGALPAGLRHLLLRSSA